MPGIIEPDGPVWVVAHGVTRDAGAVRTLADGEGRGLATWRRHRGLPPDTAVTTTLGVEGGPHAASVVAVCRAFAERHDPAETCLVYASRGGQPSYRTPLLPSLLAALPGFRHVAALRSPAPGLSVEGVLLALAYLGQARHCLLLHDATDRLGTADEPPAEVRAEHLGLSRDGGPSRLVRIRPATTAAAAAADDDGARHIPLHAESGRIALAELAPTASPEDPHA